LPVEGPDLAPHHAISYQQSAIRAVREPAFAATTELPAAPEASERTRRASARLRPCAAPSCSMSATAAVAASVTPSLPGMNWPTPFNRRPTPSRTITAVQVGDAPSHDSTRYA